MSKCYALQHIGIGGKRYLPGDELPELTDAQWMRLSRIGAIRTEHDPIEAALEAAEEEDAQMDAHTDDPDAQDAPEEGDDGADEEEAEMPDIDVMAGIADEEPQPKAKKGRKAAK